MNTHIASDSPLPYHRLARAFDSYRWWRPLLTLLVTAVAYLLILLVMGIPLVVLALMPSTAAAVEPLLTGDLNMADPVGLAGNLLILIALIPASLLGVRLGGWRPVASLMSVAGRVRWGILGRTMTGAFLVIAAGWTVMLLLDAGSLNGGRAHIDSRALVTLAIIVLLVPLQAAAEELVFRGVLMQALGSWLRHPAWAILLPVPLFVLGHEYNWIGLIDIAVFAIAMGVLTYLTGGLEAAIGVHVVNNVVVFALGALGLVDTSATDIDAFTVTFSVAVTVLITACVLWRCPRWAGSSCRTRMRGKAAEAPCGPEAPAGVPVPAQPAVNRTPVNPARQADTSAASAGTES